MPMSSIEAGKRGRTSPSKKPTIGSGGKAPKSSKKKTPPKKK